MEGKNDRYLVAGTTLLEKLPALDERTLTADPLHCQMANLALLRNALFALLPLHFPERSRSEIHELLYSRPAAALRMLRAR